MVKAADKSMTITDIELVEKHGGASGDYRRPGARSRRPRTKSTARQP
jgi:hypothetical protein